MYDLLGIGRKKKKSADRRAGKKNVPHVGKQPRSRTVKGNWRKKRKDAGTKRQKKGLFGLGW